MFLTALQQKSSKKFLEKVVTNSIEKTVNSNTISSIGLLIDADKTTSVDTIINTIGISKNISVLCFHKELEKNKEYTYPVFCKKDFGWKGKPKTEDLQKFINTPFDLLVSYYDSDELSLQLASGLNKANLKVGISGSNQQIHDVIIQTKKEETKVFAQELHKYLHILNKL